MRKSMMNRVNQPPTSDLRQQCGPSQSEEEWVEGVNLTTHSRVDTTTRAMGNES